MRDPSTDPRSFHVPGEPSATAPVPAPAESVVPPNSTPRRRRWPWVVVSLLGLMLIAMLVFTLTAWATWNSVERVELSDVLEPSGGGLNYLIVGTDSRSGVDSNVTNAGVIFGEGLGGERTDTIAVLHVEGGEISLLAIPRDLYVDIGGGSNRINAAYNFGGPEQLTTTVQRELGIGIDHYLEVDFAGFLALVDALGGVTIHFDNPVRDPKSGLRIDTAGPNLLDASEALAYVRSRNYIELIDGTEVTDRTADLGRVQRQQRFLAAIFDALGATRNPFTLLDALDGVSDNVRVDDSMSFVDVLKLAWVMRGAAPTGQTLPTTRFFTEGGADVLLLDGAAAQQMLDEFR